MERWSVRDANPERAARLERELGLRPATALALVGRGVEDPARAKSFLEPRLADLRNPEAISGFGETVRRLRQAVRMREKIGVYGDYDVDGVSTTALLTSFLRAVGAEVAPRVASRDRGYGFGEVDARWFADQGCKLIVTCDCGTSDLPAILLARGRDVDVIVIDHHQVPKGGEHPAVALLNPHRADSKYPFRGFASVGLGFLVAAGLRTSLKEAGWFADRAVPDVRELLDLVAVGTIADVAPLREENRILTAIGLERLSARARPGFDALLQRAEVELGRRVTEIDVGWRIGPRLNAPGRLGDATPSLELLMATGPLEAAGWADTCDRANQERRALQDRIYQEALEDAEPLAGEAAILVAREGWHAGVVGIVAAKLTERYGRPAAVVALDAATGQGRGSVRTARGIDVYRALASCQEHMVRWGGHAQAAGLTVETARVDDLRRGFARAAEANTPPGVAALELDALVPLGGVDERLARELGLLAPFGAGNPAPLLGARGARVRDTRRVGGDGSHLKLTLECAETRAACSAIAFRQADRDPGPGAIVDVAFSPEISTFRGERRVDLKIHSFRASSEGVDKISSSSS